MSDLLLPSYFSKQEWWNMVTLHCNPDMRDSCFSCKARAKMIACEVRNFAVLIEHIWAYEKCVWEHVPEDYPPEKRARLAEEIYFLRPIIFQSGFISHHLPIATWSCFLQFLTFERENVDKIIEVGEKYGYHFDKWRRIKVKGGNRYPLTLLPDK